MTPKFVYGLLPTIKRKYSLRHLHNYGWFEAIFNREHQCIDGSSPLVVILIDNRPIGVVMAICPELSDIQRGFRYLGFYIQPEFRSKGWVHQAFHHLLKKMPKQIKYFRVSSKPATKALLVKAKAAGLLLEDPCSEYTAYRQNKHPLL